MDNLATAIGELVIGIVMFAILGKIFETVVKWWESKHPEKEPPHLPPY